MKASYDYHFDNNVFSCIINDERKNVNLKGEKAIGSLKYLDDIQFDNIQVFKHSILLIKDNYEIQLRDLDLFVKNGLDKYIPKLYRVIEDALKTYTHNEAKKRKKHNKQLKENIKVNVTIGSILMATLVLGMSKNVKGEQGNPLTINPILLSEEIVIEADNSEEDNTFVDSLETNLNCDDTIENIVYLDFEKTGDLVKKEYAFLEYEELANWCGEKWGISPNLILMILTQESAGKEVNLMQIEWGAWAGKPISAYNFRDNKYETFLLTNNPTEEEKTKYVCITEEELKNPKTNISIGCVILRKSAEYMDYHILASLQCYNLGFGNMNEIFKKTEEETGKTKEEILSDQSNISFYDYTYLPKEGDPNYLSNVLQFIDDYGDEITFKHLQNGEIVEERINVYNIGHML